MMSCVSGRGFSPWLYRGACVAVVLLATLVAAQDLPSVQLNADNGTGKSLEDLTRKAVARDYAKAWSTLGRSLDANRSDLIEGDFVGVAQDKLATAVEIGRAHV